VITMGIRHRDRIEERLRQRLRDDPELACELAEFFAENRDEPFFVKNLNASRATSATRSSCPSATAKTPAACLSTGSGRCSPRAGNDA
jgi:hypothetical protein